MGQGRSRALNQPAIWASQAIYKFEVAVTLFEGQLWQDSCLASQQAAELIGKAILFHCDIDFRKTHDIGLIFRRAEEAEVLVMSDELNGAANQMTRDYLEGRYPRPDSERPPHSLFDKRDAIKRISWAQDFPDMAAHIMPDVLTEDNINYIHSLTGTITHFPPRG